jgi:hypothetical protein
MNEFDMEIQRIILWGFAATVILTTVMVCAKFFGLTRIDLPFMVGTLFTKSRDKAAGIGFVLHLTFGWLFAFIYGAAFELSSLNTWWFGALIGLVHSGFVLSAGLQIMTAVHPRMARSHQGPTPTRLLEPPGFLALNYGTGTPLATILAHLIYGSVLGAFY